MLDIVGLMEPLAIIAASILLYIFIFQSKFKRETGFYKNPDWNFVFKRWFAERKLNQIKSVKREKLNEKLQNNLFERPLLLKHANSSDEVLFYGTDQIGNSILLRMTRLRHRTADLWITLRLKNGKCYTLPEHPRTRVYEVTTGKFKASGLEFECLEPFVRWRITYSGFMRCGITNKLVDDIDENNLEYIKFNFFFTASNKPLFWPLDWSSRLMATGLATELWKDGSWPNVLNIPGNGGYDQCGCLRGQIFLPDNEIIEVSLPGMRQRRWEAHENFNLRRYVTVYGVCTQGCIFNIGAISCQKALSHVQFGNVRLSNGDLHPIDWTDFWIPNIAEEVNQIPQKTAIHFSAAGRTFKAFLYFEHDQIVELLNGSKNKWHIVNAPMKFDLNTSSGYGLLSAWFPYDDLNESKRKEPFRLRKLVFNQTLPDRNKFVFGFDEDETQSKFVAGGKGASLGLLSLAHYELYKITPFEVPQGIIVSSSALRQFLLTNSDIYLDLKKLEETCLGKSDANIEKLCENIKEHIKKSKLDDCIESEIRSSLIRLKTGFKKPCFAIRSSGVDEDGKEFSSAGQNETILGISDIENVLDAVKECWASLFSYRSVEYRRTHAQSIIADMAVVIQTMIPSECSGVLFTQHSIENHVSDILITANYGLGETVVSGSVEPDTFLIRKNYDSTKFVIIKTILGEKKFSLILQESGNIEKVENKTKDVGCLSEEIIYKLVKIGVNLEKMYGDPQDIEWAVYNGTIYLLQSRPITTIKQFSDWEYLHESDSPIMTTNQLLTRGNVGEVFACATDHLTLSTITKTMNINWVRNKTDILEKITITKGLITAYQKVFMDLFSFFRVPKSGEVYAKDKVAMFGLLGSLEFTPQIKLAAYNRNGPLTWNDYLDVLKIFLSALTAAKQLKKFENIIEHFRLINLSDKINSFKTAHELLFEIDALIDRTLLDATSYHMDTSTANSILQNICLNILLEGADDFSNEHISDLAKIMHVTEGVISAEIPKKIDEIANTIYLQCKNYRDFCELKADEVEPWLEENCPVAFRQYNQFFRTFGHRCLNEFCLKSVPWETNKEYILKMIQDNIKQIGLHQGHIHQETETELILDDLVTPKKQLTKWILKFLIPYCHRSIQRREHSKNYYIYFVNILRKHFIRLSELMQLEGILPQKNLIFFLTRYELHQLILHNEISLIQKASRRQKLYSSWDKLKFPDVVFGELKSPDKEECKIPFDSGSKIVGIPAQNGIVEGRACVLTDISQIGEIESGDILITYATDIAWSPVFPILGGLITELGGLISHGAVVAREYGLPCLIGAKNATNCFNTGDRVYLDANSGFITKL